MIIYNPCFSPDHVTNVIKSAISCALIPLSPPILITGHVCCLIVCVDTCVTLFENITNHDSLNQYKSNLNEMAFIFGRYVGL